MQNYTEVLGYPAWQRFLTALLTYALIMYDLTKSGTEFGLTDTSIVKILLICLSPTAWLEFKIIELRSTISDSLLSGAMLAAV